MKLTNPKKVRELFAKKKRWLTVEEIAAGLKMSTRTVSKGLSGKPMRPNTVRVWASALDVDATEIATFLN